MAQMDVETKSKIKEFIYLAVLLALSSPILVAFALLVISSFGNQMATNFDFSTFRFTLKNWKLLFEGRIAITGGLRENIWLHALSTAIVAGGVAVVTTLVGTLTGYAISRIKFRGRKILLLSMLLIHALPGSVLIVGVYFLYRILMPSNMIFIRYFSFFYVIFARAALEVPLSVWLMKGFFDLLPWETEWSALIDGASRLKVWRKILLPLIKPGIVAVLIFGFLAGWQDIIYVRTFLIDKTLATFIESNLETEIAYMPLLAAAATFYLLPTIVFYISSQQLLFKVYTGGIRR
ncbi:carbohydrate ABC transporter permease [Pseudothermotoga thermarum]|uniref:Carbohydrate ABC transporter membrane protein 2, CUT1 family n=1 Tax=Pseudothermotoga thermarum DSM 5069 TaxID=688269 RepID=F7YY64_9THEM|nr:carbohydrate ABC transporter permease [Pseudothermotoga thermarum]AEH50879.1 carbohydrate ABC transporter membrane protein 2, CUT1 family [Pseudothermotoga thermarum DSM 5069]